MPFVNYKEVDGFNVVTSFDPPSVDPVESHKIVDPLWAETTEYKKAEALSEKFGQLEQRRQQLLAAARRARNKGEHEAIGRAYEAVVQEQKAIQAEAKANKPALTKQRSDLLKEHAVFFQVPNCNEVDQETVDELSAKLHALKPGQFLTLEGFVIDDHRGEIYWIKDEFECWSKVTIRELGEEIPTGAKPRTEITQEDLKEIVHQRNIERISGLTPEQKEDEKAARIKNVLAASATKRSEFEIEGHENPLSQAKQWYNERKAEIENLYK